jgi:hypothetical protein
MLASERRVVGKTPGDEMDDLSCRSDAAADGQHARSQDVEAGLIDPLIAKGKIAPPRRAPRGAECARKAWRRRDWRRLS